jgi:RNA polymerase sigma-70 factor (ECF subfamily)
VTASREKILLQIRERILAYATSRIGKDFSEDLAQEALMVLETKYAHVEAIEELVPLAFRILRFKMNDHRRRMSRPDGNHSVPVDDLPLADGAPDPAVAAERKQMEQRLAAAIAGLGSRCREIFRMKLEGRTFSEIQKELKASSINTVYTWDFRCRKELLEKLGGRWL